MYRNVSAPLRGAKSGKEGMILFAVLAVVSGLAMIAATMFTITTTNLRVATNYRDTARAFFNADAGIQSVKARIEADLAAGTLALANTNAAVNYSAPSGYTFDTVRLIQKLGLGPVYGFSVTGRANAAIAVINTTFTRRPAFNLGVFADSSLELKPNSFTYSYYSDVVTNPTPANSTGEADVGSNEQLRSYNGTYVDGSLLLGADVFGNTATWSGHSGTIITGQKGTPVGRMDPDPLGAATGGPLARTFSQIATNNNNANRATPPIPANRNVSIGNSATLILRSGNYFINNIELKNGATLQVLATNGPVNVYLTGNIDFKNGSAVNYNGKPSDFNVFANRVGGSIVLYHGGDMNAVIYAPFSFVDIKNSGAFRGLLWADSIDMKNSGVIYVDVSTRNKFLSNKIQIQSWKEARM